HSLGQKSEPLENRTIAEAIGVGDQLLRVSIFSTEITGQTISDVTNFFAHGWIVEEIDHGAMHIGDKNLGSTSPHWTSPEEQFLANVVNRERHGLEGLLRLANWPCGVDEDRPKELLRQVPVLRGTGTANVRGTKKLRDERSRVFDDLILMRSAEGHGRV